MPEFFDQDTTRRACHEAGHIALCKLRGIPYRGATLTEVTTAVTERHPSNNPDDLLLLAVAGFASEKVFFHDGEFGGGDQKTAFLYATATQPENPAWMVASAVEEAMILISANRGPVESLVKELCHQRTLSPARAEQLWQAAPTHVQGKRLAQGLREARAAKLKPKPSRWHAAPPAMSQSSNLMQGEKRLGNGNILTQSGYQIRPDGGWVAPDGFHSVRDDDPNVRLLQN